MKKEEGSKERSEGERGREEMSSIAREHSRIRLGRVSGGDVPPEHIKLSALRRTPA
jgi:hypothetical protein